MVCGSDLRLSRAADESTRQHHSKKNVKLLPGSLYTNAKTSNDEITMRFHLACLNRLTQGRRTACAWKLKGSSSGWLESLAARMPYTAPCKHTDVSQGRGETTRVDQDREASKDNSVEGLKDRRVEGL